ncbi:macrolide family glycosyltransferase [Actinomadura sp. 9N215]|uniref:macrolide family glycosyltransferase n=1 Tax=Actinomadura sp. 9N215 TaxID=3375150 RepID=UPI0037B6AEB7
MSGGTGAHIAMFGIPAHGHVNPGLAVIRELVDRGHRVTYSINEKFAPQVEAAGATPVLYDSTLPPDDEPGAWPADGVQAVFGILREAMAVLPQMEAAYEHDRPDLFLYDLGGYTARILATRWDRPIIQLSPAAVPWKGYEEDMAPVVEAMQRNPRYREYEAAFTAWLRENGVDMHHYEFWGRPERCIALIPRSLQPNDKEVPDNYTFVGPCLGDRTYQGTWRPPETQRPVLYISLGSAYNYQPEFYRTCMAAFGGLEWHAVMQIGRFVDPAELGPIPANFEVHPFVPQLSVLRRADAFITHAGMASTLEALYHGVPMVAVPQLADQFGNAKRLADLGVGRFLPTEDVAAETLRAAVLDLAGDHEITARLGALREEMRLAGGARAAADIIEARLGEARLGEGIR